MTSEVKQLHQLQLFNVQNRTTDKVVRETMLKKDKVPNYLISSRTSSSQPIFHKTSTTRHIDCTSSGASLAKATESGSRSPSIGGGIDDIEELFSNNEDYEDNNQDQDECQRDGQANNADGKQHVGPLGIFFKVWSLVKVTKARHSKLHRQNSESASQFQYISGDNFNQQRQLQPTSKQPALMNRIQSNQLAQDNNKHHIRHSLAKQPASGSIGNPNSKLKANHQIANMITSASNSTSSGISSSNNSTLAKSSPPPQMSNNICKRPIQTTNYSSSNLRRSTTELLRSNQQQRPTSLANSSNYKFKWASRIRRSATSVNTFSEAARSPSTGSQYATPLNVRKNHLQGQQQIRGASEMAYRSREAEMLASRHSEEEFLGASCGEEDSNDIYTTPNNSIQSVPSTAPIFAGNPFYHPAPTRTTSKIETTSSSSLIKKSFSTNNFSNLVNTTTTTTTTTPLATQADIINEESAVLNPSGSGSDRRSKNSITSSRFFISSSSSEDSNCQPNLTTQKNSRVLKQAHQMSEQQDPRENNMLQQSISLEMASRNQDLSNQNGVHTHQSAQPFSSYPAPGQATSFLPVLEHASNGQPIASVSPAKDAYSNRCQAQRVARLPPITRSGYKKSPSLFEMATSSNYGILNGADSKMSRFSSKYPVQQPAELSSFRPKLSISDINNRHQLNSGTLNIPSSISLQSCNLANLAAIAINNNISEIENQEQQMDHYRLAEMLLELGRDKEARDENGCTALMQAVISDNLAAIKCLIEYGLDVNDLNNAEESCLDLLCQKAASKNRIQILWLLIESGALFERQRNSDKSRLLDRLIGEHSQQQTYSTPAIVSSPSSVININANDKSAYIECLLQNGAKLSSKTWQAANGKHEIQLRLIKKICQDGYYLYKQQKSNIEAAVYRFEYALRRLTELECQVIQGTCIQTYQQQQHLQNQLQQHRHSNLFRQHHHQHQINPHSQNYHQLTLLSAKRLKYQLYLGLSRAERKRKFFKRALEFVQMAILIDSSSYEAFYSKAHILRDLEELDGSLVAIEQTANLLDNSIEQLELELRHLSQQHEELLIFDNCFGGESPYNESVIKRGIDLVASPVDRLGFIESSLQENQANLEYLREVSKYICKLKNETLEEKLKQERTKLNEAPTTIVLDRKLSN